MILNFLYQVHVLIIENKYHIAMGNHYFDILYINAS